MPAEVIAPEKPVTPPSPATPVENPNVSVDQAKLQDMQQVDTLENELADVVAHSEVQPTDKVEHDGKTILQSTHAFRVEGDSIIIEETPGEFKSDLNLSPDESRRWFAVWIERMAKVWHKVMIFSRT